MMNGHGHSFAQFSWCKLWNMSTNEEVTFNPYTDYACEQLHLENINYNLTGLLQNVHFNINSWSHKWDNPLKQQLDLQWKVQKSPAFADLFVHHVFPLVGYWRAVHHCRVRHWVSKQVAHPGAPLHVVGGSPHVVPGGVVSLTVHGWWSRAGVFKENRICGGGSCTSSRLSWGGNKELCMSIFLET